MRTLYAISKNGAVWSNYQTAGHAIDRAAVLATEGQTTARYQGFDEHNKTAVVERPIVWRVEELEFDERRGWTCKRIVAEWVGGVRQAVTEVA